MCLLAQSGLLSNWPADTMRHELGDLRERDQASRQEWSGISKKCKITCQCKRAEINNTDYLKRQLAYKKVLK